MSTEDRISGIERVIRGFGFLASKNARFWLLVTLAGVIWLLFGLVSYGRAEIAAARAEAASKEVRLDALSREFREELLKERAVMIAVVERNTAASEHSTAAWERVRMILERLPAFRN